MQSSQGNRRGAVFTVRVTDEERAQLERLRDKGRGPAGLGPFMLWRALDKKPAPASRGQVLPAGEVIPATKKERGRRIILDLCAGTGAWSTPYARAGYDVRRVTLPVDVRTFCPPRNVHGVLAAPPCTEFSRAKNGRPRDFVRGLETVSACMRIILTCRPTWWALENPTGLLGRYLGTPRDVFQPHHFGDPWTKQTALWGDFAIPARGPFVKPTESIMSRRSVAEIARTPAGFARAFFLANP